MIWEANNQTPIFHNNYYMLSEAYKQAKEANMEVDLMISVEIIQCQIVNLILRCQMRRNRCMIHASRYHKYQQLSSILAIYAYQFFDMCMV